MPPQKELPNVDCRSVIASVKAAVSVKRWMARGRAGPQDLRLHLRQLGAIEVKLRNWNYFHVGEIFLKRGDEIGGFTDDDETRRGIEIFRGEGSHIGARHSVNRRNKFVQSIERQIVGDHGGDFPDEATIRFQAARVRAAQHGLA